MNPTYSWHSNVNYTGTDKGYIDPGDNSRRGCYRLPFKLPVQFELTGGPVISAFSHDLSVNGMQIRCEHPHLRQLAKNKSVYPNLGALVVMRMQVENRITCQVLRCRLSYLKELRTGEVSLGLQFDGLLPDQEMALRHVMEQTDINDQQD